MELLTAREREDAIKARRAEAENALKSIIGDAGGIEGLCTWRQNQPSVVTDWEAVARELFEDMKVLRLPAGTAPCDEGYLQAVVKEHTNEKPGSRPFNLITTKEK
jgi:hypothetical protein